MFRNFLIFAIFATCCGYAFASDGNIPVWPMVGSEVDIQAFDCEEGGGSDNVRIVSKIGDDLIIDNHINPNTSPFASFSGGADMLHGRIVPAGFGVLDGAEMPLLRAEMLEDDGATVLAMSGPVRANTTVLNNVNWADYSAAAADVNSETILDVEERDSDAKDLDVKSWVVASGQTLREVLQAWCDQEGWDLAWLTPREYPIAASAVFRGRFMDVSSGLVRNFSRAAPIPYAKFYKGNRVLVVSTTGE